MCQETEQRAWLSIWWGGCWVHVYLAPRDRIRSRGTLDQGNKSKGKLRKVKSEYSGYNWLKMSVTGDRSGKKGERGLKIHRLPFSRRMCTTKAMNFCLGVWIRLTQEVMKDKNVLLHWYHSILRESVSNSSLIKQQNIYTHMIFFFWGGLGRYPSALSFHQV